MSRNNEGIPKTKKKKKKVVKKRKRRRKKKKKRSNDVILLDVHRQDTYEYEIIINKSNLPRIRIGDFIELKQDNVGPILLRVSMTMTSKKLHGVNYISIKENVQNSFNFQQRKPISIRKVTSEEELNEPKFRIDVVELVWSNSFLSSVDQFLFREHLIRKVRLLYMNQRVKTPNGVTVRITGLYHDYGGQRKMTQVSSGVVHKNSRFVFRTKSSEFYFLFQMSREMWFHSSDGDIHFEKAINGFMKQLMEMWDEQGIDHLIRIIFFTRVYLSDVLRKMSEREGKEFKENVSGLSEFQKSLLRNQYVDFYEKIGIRGLRNDQWVRILDDIKSVSIRFPLQIQKKLREEMKEYPSFLESLNRKSFTNMLSQASKSNFFEIINLVLNKYSIHNINRHTHHTSQHFVVISPGTGVFDILDTSLAKLTKKKIVEQGVSIDVVYLSHPPTHYVPIFRIPRDEKMRRSMSSKNDLTSAENLEFFEIHQDFTEGLPIDPKLVKYKVPKWIQVSFYQEKKARKKPGFLRSFKPTMRLPLVRDQVSTMPFSLPNFQVPNPIEPESFDERVFTSHSTHTDRYVKRALSPYRNDPKYALSTRSIGAGRTKRGDVLPRRPSHHPHPTMLRPTVVESPYPRSKKSGVGVHGTSFSEVLLAEQIRNRKRTHSFVKPISHSWQDKFTPSAVKNRVTRTISTVINPFQFDSYRRLKVQESRSSIIFRRFRHRNKIMKHIRQIRQGGEVNEFVPDWSRFCEPDCLPLETHTWLPASVKLKTNPEQYNCVEFDNYTLQDLFWELVFQRLQQQFQILVPFEVRNRTEIRLNCLNQFHVIVFHKKEGTITVEESELEKSLFRAEQEQQRKQNQMMIMMKKKKKKMMKINDSLYYSSTTTTTTTGGGGGSSIHDFTSNPDYHYPINVKRGTTPSRNNKGSSTSQNLKISVGNKKNMKYSSPHPHINTRRKKKGSKKLQQKKKKKKSRATHRPSNIINMRGRVEEKEEEEEEEKQGEEEGHENDGGSRGDDNDFDDDDEQNYARNTSYGYRRLVENSSHNVDSIQKQQQKKKKLDQEDDEEIEYPYEYYLLNTTLSDFVKKRVTLSLSEKFRWNKCDGVIQGDFVNNGGLDLDIFPRILQYHIIPLGESEVPSSPIIKEKSVLERFEELLPSFVAQDRYYGLRNDDSFEVTTFHTPTYSVTTKITKKSSSNNNGSSLHVNHNNHFRTPSPLPTSNYHNHPSLEIQRKVNNNKKKKKNSSRNNRRKYKKNMKYLINNHCEDMEVLTLYNFRPGRIRKEWIRLFYKTTYSPNESFVFEIRWLVANANLLNKYISFLSRRAESLGFRLLKTPFIPICYEFSKNNQQQHHQQQQQQKNSNNILSSDPLLFSFEKRFLECRSFDYYPVLELPVVEEFRFRCLDELCMGMSFVSESYPITEKSKRFVHSTGTVILILRKNNNNNKNSNRSSSKGRVEMLWVENIYRERLVIDLKMMFGSVKLIIEKELKKEAEVLKKRINPMD